MSANELMRGLAVLELGQGIAGSVAGKLMADQGAMVTKVAFAPLPAVTPAHLRTAFTIWDRDKRLVNASDLAALLDSADIVIDQEWSAGRAPFASLLDAAAWRQRNRQGIYCVIETGLPFESDELSVPDLEALVSARSGMFTRNGRGAASRLPVYVDLPIPSMHTAAQAMVAIAAALFEREVSGQGSSIGVALSTAPAFIKGIPTIKVAESTGIDLRTNLGAAVSGIYPAGDGRYVNLAVGSKRRSRRLLAALREAGLPAAPLEILVQDYERLPLEELTRLRRSLRAHLEAIFVGQSAAYWEEFLSARGVPCALCRRPSEWLRHPQAEATGVIQTLNLSEQSELRGLGQVIQTRVRGTGATAPPDRAGLKGLRALDLTTVIAGPVCGRTLADFGVEVLKIDEPNELPMFFPHMHLDTNRGKRHLILNLKDPEGQAIFKELVARTDIVLENARNGVWERLGVGYEDLLAVNPNLIFAAFKAYGSQGPWATWGGFEPTAQSATGLTMRYGGMSGQPQDSEREAPGGAFSDYSAPLFLDFAILLAARARRLRPASYHVETSLAASATLFQSADLHAMESLEASFAGGPGWRGPSLHARLWPGADGWVYAVLPGDALARFVQAVAPGEALPDETMAGALESISATFPGATLVAFARDAGGYATVTPHNDQLIQRLEAEGVYQVDDYPAWGETGHIGYPVTFEPPLAHAHRPVPGWGEHTRITLAELGRSDAEIDRLLARGVIQ